MVKLLVIGLYLVLGVSSKQRITGGSVTSIQQYPFAAALLLQSSANSFRQVCGGTILNNRSILSAAHCFSHNDAHFFRIRIGSTYANSGGVVHVVSQRIIHPNYNEWNFDNDVGILRLASTISFNSNVQAGSIAGVNYILGDNVPVWPIGWGYIGEGQSTSEKLRHVQIWTINQNTCRARYAEQNLQVTDSMLCAGWLDVGGRGACGMDSGGALLHNNVVVGIVSAGVGCGVARYPGIYARVSRFTPWIQSNA